MAPASKQKRYSACMKDFLHHHGHVYSSDEVARRDIPQDVLVAITPKMIVEYLNQRAYGQADPSDDDRPILARSTTLSFYKKALSSFMFLHNTPWDDILLRGNPTKSKDVNDMIKKVVKHEVRHEGVSSKARRGFEWKEYLQLMKLIRKRGFKGDESMVQQLKWSRLYAMLAMQWQLMARMDDMLNISFESITTHLSFPFSLKAQMRWSKNICEEREVPEQVVFPSMEYNVDPILSLALYLEVSDTAGELLSKEGHVFGGEKGRNQTRRMFESLLNDEDFEALLAGLVGNHSIRKGAATFGMRCGLSRDHINRRGRWRVRRQVVDVYIDHNLPYPDALAASKLCGQKGPCKYVIDKRTDVSSAFILEKVVPESRRLLGDAAALPLGQALLWAAFHQKNNPHEEFPLMPSWLMARVMAQYELSYGNIVDCSVDNPIRRVSITPQGFGDQCHIIELDVEEDNGDTVGTVQVRAGGVVTADSSASLLAHQVTMQRQVEETKSVLLHQLFELRTLQQKQYAIMSRNIKRIAVQPVVRSRLVLRGHVEPLDQEQEDEDDRDIVPRQPVKLYRCPKTLFDLWQEYQFGLNGCKPAKDFTAVERGKSKTMYCRRKVFWDVITNLVRAGHTSDTAIDKVYEAYGRSTSVTQILLQMIRDRKQGGHPGLRVGHN